MVSLYMLADFNLAVEKHTAKLPNLILHQIFQLHLYTSVIILLCIKIKNLLKTNKISSHTVMQQLSLPLPPPLLACE